MNQQIPKNGLLSGMLLTGATAAVTIPLALFNDSFRARFNAPLPPELMHIFLASLIAMAIHKGECFWSKEYEQCPVYLTSGRSWSDNIRRAIFLTFVPTFLGMMFAVYLAFLGPPWHLVLLTVWLGQGLHELHHLAKSASRRRLYPGTASSLLFVTIQSALIFPRWHDLIFPARGLFFDGYYLSLPAVFLAFYLEDRNWTAKAPAEVWDPA